MNAFWTNIEERKIKYLEASRELDGLIHELMAYPPTDNPPPYSTDFLVAWNKVACRFLGFRFQLEKRTPGAVARLYSTTSDIDTGVWGAPTEALAICIVVLAYQFELKSNQS